MPKIQIVSDLHEDLNKNGPVKVTGDHLVLAGDISDYPEHWDPYAELDIPVIAVLGNHEFINKEGSVADRVQEYKNRFENSLLSVLYNEILTVDGITYFGTTLWSDISSVPNTLDNNLNARGASGLTIEDWLIEYRDSINFLDNMLPCSEGRPTVVVSHFSPSYLSESPLYRGRDTNKYFHSNLENLIRRHQPALWIHGHIHSSVDYYIASTRILANPRGSTRHGSLENPAFKKNLIIQMES